MTGLLKPKAPEVKAPPPLQKPEPMPDPEDRLKQVEAERRIAQKIYSSGRESTYISGKTKLG